MKTGPQFKIARRLGAPIFSKTQSPKFERSNARPGRPFKNRRGGTSDYKKQLIEKQKMRLIYGLSERQMQAYVSKAVASGDQPIVKLFELLESRLDNCVFRIGLAQTRRQARQMVTHGHITVNGRKLNVPSAHIRVGDVISVREGSRNIGILTNLTDRTNTALVPGWLTFDVKAMSGEKKQVPTVDQKELLFDPELVLEYYSR